MSEGVAVLINHHQFDMIKCDVRCECYLVTASELYSANNTLDSPSTCISAGCVFCCHGMSNLSSPLTISTAVIWAPGVFLHLALFWSPRGKPPRRCLLGLASEKPIKTSVEHVDDLKPAARRTCDPSPIPQRLPPVPWHGQAGWKEEAVFSGALSCALLYSTGPEGLREPSPHAVYLLLPNMASWRLLLQMMFSAAASHSRWSRFPGAEPWRSTNTDLSFIRTDVS